MSSGRWFLAWLAACAVLGLALTWGIVTSQAQQDVGRLSQQERDSVAQMVAHDRQARATAETRVQELEAEVKRLTQAGDRAHTATIAWQAHAFQRVLAQCGD